MDYFFSSVAVGVAGGFVAGGSVFPPMPSLKLRMPFNMNKEGMVIHDGSSDGTRQWLLETAKRQASGAREVENLGGRARHRLENLGFSF